MAEKQITITERDRRVIRWVATLSDNELFGLECFLAGAKIAAQEKQCLNVGKSSKEHKEQIND